MAAASAAAALRWSRVFKTQPLGEGSASQRGRCVRLGWCMSGNPLAAESLATAGFDAVCVDAQHGAAGVGSETVLQCIRVVSLSGVVPVARAPAASGGGVDLPAVGWLLDAGARAIIAPLIHTPDEAAAFVSACHLPNETEGVLGTRSWGAFSSLARGEAGNDVVLAIGMIETSVAMDQPELDAIASTPGLDALFIGTNDLALSLGLQTSALVDNNATILEAVDNVRNAARRHGLRVGMFCPPSVAGFWSSAGEMDIVAPGADIIYMRSAAVAAAEEIAYEK